jgi:hypothetical protein
MLYSNNHQSKKKNVTDKEVIEFLSFLEEKMDYNQNKLQSFMEICHKFNNGK